MADDWEQWADDDGPQEVPTTPIVQTEIVKVEQQQSQKTVLPNSEQRSKQTDMNNVLDLFLDSDQAREVKVKVADFKVIGENLALKMNSSAITSVQSKDLLKSLIVKLDKKLSLIEWQEIYQTVDAIYLAKKKVYDDEEAKKKKQTKVPPRGINWGKTKGCMDLNDDDAYGDDDDDFM